MSGGFKSWLRRLPVFAIIVVGVAVTQNQLVSSEPLSGFALARHAGFAALLGVVVWCIAAPILIRRRGGAPEESTTKGSA